MIPLIDWLSHIRNKWLRRVLISFVVVCMVPAVMLVFIGLLIACVGVFILTLDFYGARNAWWSGNLNERGYDK